MEFPDDLRYHDEDTWARLEEDDDRVRVGITDFAQDQLGDIVFVELPKVGTEVKVGEPFGMIESTKTASDLHAPVSGKVVEANSGLEAEPEAVNEDPYGRGWIILVEPTEPLGEELMDASTYRKRAGAG